MIFRRALRIAAAALGLALAAPLPAAAISPQPVEGRQGMVVSDQAIASAVGAAILRAGGNAVDAAVAVGYAQAVVNPCCGNIGGGGFMVLRLADGRAFFIDFREEAPGAATPNMYLDSHGQPIPGASLDGWLAVGVPGSVLGLDTALTRFGTMTRQQVMAPAIALARDGFVLAPGDAAIFATATEAFRRDPAIAKIFLKDGAPLQPGDRLVQTDLAATLSAIAETGPAAFYEGALPEKIAAASAAGGGILKAADFAHYTAPVSAPVACSYRGYDILSAPPPSSGGVALCEMLGILEGYPLGFLGYGSSEADHFMIEAMRQTYLDRNSDLGDPAFVQNPVDRLISKAYTAAIRATIERYRATPSSELKPGTPPHEGTETTHYSVLDAAGNAVAVTFSLNAYFGAKVMAPGAGFFLNDTMDDFTMRPGVPNMFGLVQGAANAIAPGKRPLSSMTPAILTRDGKPFMVLGSPGGSRIPTAVLQTIVNVIDHGMTLQEAVDAPRFHHQWLPDVVYAEPYAMSPDTRKALAAMGYKIVVQKPWSAVEAILAPGAKPSDAAPPSFADDTLNVWKPAAGTVFGANDNRRPAGAAVAQ
ncbi:gamma-glutamyltransferase [Segnochrobactrum spirostomi]|uniref:Glutathione hydrolase proenzyme n=1 Tax=Segnochrobactrum spirostomi TaxID=2608987 RepID=A0A6A7Y2Z7_9HYPH|nr:gamma-glutamyltransferase [Segnochrobactrum spirostomi]MQT12471.1 gamma-glutamyltransferase [Segnochrobactrum spirostomi]